MINLISMACRSVVAKARRDERGGVATMFAVGALAIVGVIGAAVDYNNSVQARTKMQTALDAAVLNAMQQSAPGQRIVQARQAFEANLSSLPVTNVRAEFTNNANGTLTGAAAASASNSIMRVLGPVTDVHARSTAAVRQTIVSTPATVTINVTNAKGWYWKRMTLWARVQGAASDTLLATYVYQPTNLYLPGSGTTSGPFGTPITLGTNYLYAYFKMEVSPDGCAPGFAPQDPTAMQNPNAPSWNPYTCLPVGGSVQKTAVPYTFATNDPATSNHLFVNGQMLPQGRVATIFDLTACGQTWRHSWEDTRAYDPWSLDNMAAWQSQDIFFDVTAGPCTTNTALSTTSGPRLVR
jgi:Flp pilus assembly protein TadG